MRCEQGMSKEIAVLDLLHIFSPNIYGSRCFKKNIWSLLGRCVDNRTDQCIGCIALLFKPLSKNAGQDGQMFVLFSCSNETHTVLEENCFLKLNIEAAIFTIPGRTQIGDLVQLHTSRQRNGHC